MSLVKCATVGCRHHVREGLRRPYLVKGVHGQDLADGRRCWRCRRRHASPGPRPNAETRAAMREARRGGLPRSEDVPSLMGELNAGKRKK